MGFPVNFCHIWRLIPSNPKPKKRFDLLREKGGFFPAELLFAQYIQLHTLGKGSSSMRIGMKSGIMLGLLGLLASGADAQTHNALTEAEKAAGYTLLYNGKDLTGWRSWDVTTAPSSWESTPESTWQVMNIRSGQPNTGSIVTSDATLMNFDFKVEWATSVNGNSGIFIRYMTNPPVGAKDSWGGSFGPESQVVDINNSDGNSDLHRAGDCYDLFDIDPNLRSWVYNGSTLNGQPNYRYNQFRMVVFGNHVAHYGNGKKLLEYLAHSTTWNTAYNKSKYKDKPLYGDAHAGSIYFQNHGQTNIHFRDIRIKNLGADAKNNPWAKGSPYLKDPNDTTSGLKDNLPSADNVVFGTVGLAPAPAYGEDFGLRSEGSTLFFRRSGDYVVRIGDLSGRTRDEIRVRGSDRVLLPADKGPSVISVRSSQGAQSLILPPSK